MPTQVNTLRFITCGSVDDGKSTLIGRLLLDAHALLTDQLDNVLNNPIKTSQGLPDLALVTDGLRAEREQGITIDIAYKYFTSTQRKFIIADAPGHEQYTRNMVTGASKSDVALIIIDARKGVTQQTRRHTIINALLGIQHFVVVINKMDLVDYNSQVYDQICTAFTTLAAELTLAHLYFVPVSALLGDNVVEPSATMHWYKGKPLLKILESIELASNSLQATRFVVQWVIRPQTKDLPDYRGYAGIVKSGCLKTGDTVIVLPAGIETTVEKIEIGGKILTSAEQGQSIVVHLNDKLDIGRGDLLVLPQNLTKVAREVETMVCWMDNEPIKPGKQYLLQLHGRVVKAVIKTIDYKLNITTLTQETGLEEGRLNDLLKLTIKTAVPIHYDAYAQLPQTGSAILINTQTNATAAACMLL